MLVEISHADVRRTQALFGDVSFDLLRGVAIGMFPEAMPFKLHLSAGDAGTTEISTASCEILDLLTRIAQKTFGSVLDEARLARHILRITLRSIADASNAIKTEAARPSDIYPSTGMPLQQLIATFTELRDQIANLRTLPTVLAETPPVRILVLTKPGDPRLVSLTRELCEWLLRFSSDIFLWVNAYLEGMKGFRTRSLIKRYGERLAFWQDVGQGVCAHSDTSAKSPLPTTQRGVPAAHQCGAELVITLGGDGTVLHASHMFQHDHCPPIFPFHLGSLGFLTVFDFERRRKELAKVLNGERVMVSLRGRIKCQVFRRKRRPSGSFAFTNDQNISRDGDMSKSHSTEAGDENDAFGDGEDDYPNASSFESESDDGDDEQRFRLRCDAIHRARLRESSTGNFSDDDSQDDAKVIRPASSSSSSLELALQTKTTPTADLVSTMNINWELAEEWQVLNDVVVDRGSAASMCQLELYADGVHLTTILADGLVVASSTGSTAYSLSAGGSLVHPNVNAILVTPICPHTLTCRPMLLPGAQYLKIVVPASARTTAWVSFDGRHRTELRRGDHLIVTSSHLPVPTICRADPSRDWFRGLRRVLQWNERSSMQKPTTEAASGTRGVSRKASSRYLSKQR